MPPLRTSSRALSIALAVLALSACASLAPYGAQTGSGGQGYAEQRIESNRFRVTYNGVGAPAAADSRFVGWMWGASFTLAVYLSAPSQASALKRKWRGPGRLRHSKITSAEAKAARCSP